MNIEQARFNMIEQQIRPWEVLDPQVLDLLFVVKREDFVPAAYRNLAFADMEIPIGSGQVMLAPRVEARLLQELGIKKTDKVLEIGTGSGYMAALLAAGAEHVVSIENRPELAEFARQNLERAGVTNVTVEVGNGAAGWSQRGPYDAIVSIEMFEAVGHAYWPGFFRRVHELLRPGGRACIQSITIRDDLFERYLHHIKLVVHPDGSLEAKAYLASRFGWVDDKTLKQRIDQVSPSPARRFDDAVRSAGTWR